MKRWLIDFSCDSECGLHDSLKDLVHTLPSGESVAFGNFGENDDRFRGFRLQVILSAENSDTAQADAEVLVRSLVRDLAFMTKLRFGDPVIDCIVDWSPGLDVRNAYRFQHYDDPDFYRVLDSKLINALGTIRESENYADLRRCFHWFNAGINARVTKDQFQYFWFVLEVVSAIQANRIKVVDKCQKCRGELFCKECGKLSKHRPFNKDLIIQTLSSFGVGEAIQKDLFLVRNGLSHGQEPNQIEADIRAGGSTEFTFHAARNVLATVAGRAIVTKLALKNAPEIPWVEKTDYALRKIQGKLEMKSKFPYREEHDEYIRLDMPKIEMIEGEGERPQA